jgi:hypothetical protein
MLRGGLRDVLGGMRGGSRGSNFVVVASVRGYVKYIDFFRIIGLRRSLT